ncbi:MAG: mechanosensitive ion channel family protein [Acidimicrobiales bacterium]
MRRAITGVPLQGLFPSQLTQTDSSESQGSSESQEDLVSQVGGEIEVGLDRWSAGQLDVTDLIVALAVVVAAAALSWLLRRLFARLAPHAEGPTATAVLVGGQLASVAVYLFAAGIVLEVLGFGLGPILVLVLVIVVAALFLQPLIQNLSAGLLLQLRGPFKPGDVIDSNDTVGVVEEVNARTVVIITKDGRSVHIPNRDVLDHTLVNYSVLGRRRSEMALRLAGEAGQVDAIDRLQHAVAGVGAVLTEPPPEVLLTGFDGTQVEVEVQFWHAPQLSAEGVARDSVARAVLDAVDATDLVLEDPRAVVTNVPPVHAGG